jgi:hypothetical protein
MYKTLSWLFMFTLLVSCYRNAEGPNFDMSLVASPDSMVSILTDIHLLDGVVNTVNLKDTAMDSLARADYNIVLAKHGMDRRSFEESIHYYAFHAEELDKIYEKVIINLGKKESELTISKDSIKN